MELLEPISEITGEIRCAEGRVLAGWPSVDPPSWAAFLTCAPSASGFLVDPRWNFNDSGTLGARAAYTISAALPLQIDCSINAQPFIGALIIATTLPALISHDLLPRLPTGLCLCSSNLVYLPAIDFSLAISSRCFRDFLQQRCTHLL